MEKLDIERVEVVDSIYGLFVDVYYSDGTKVRKECDKDRSEGDRSGERFYFKN